MASSTTAALRIVFGADSSQLDKALGHLQKKLRATGKSLKAAGRTMSVGVTAPLVAIGASSFQVAAQFEASMAKVKAVSGASADEFKRLSEQAKELGRTTVFTASDVAQLQLEFSKLGFTAAEIDKVTESTLYLAQATGSDLATAAEVAGATLRGFGLDASETQRVTDVMAASFSSSALDMNSFRESMKYVAPVAKSAGLSLEETTAMLASLANSGIKGSQAGTALRRILSQLAGEGQDVSTEIAKLAGEGLNLADAKDEVGRSAQTALLILSEALGPTMKLTEQFKQAEGAAGGMAGTMNETADGALKRMRSAVEGAQIAIGSALAPTMVRLAGAVERLATKFTEADPALQSLIIGVGALAAGIGPGLLALGQMTTGLGALLPALSKARTAIIGLNLATQGPLIIGITAAVGTIMLFNHMLGEQRRKLDEVTAAQGRMAKAAKGQVTRFEKEAAAMDSEAIEARVAALKAEREELGATMPLLNDRVAQLTYDSRLTAAALQSSKTRTSLTADGNIVTEQATEEVKRLGEATAELVALENEQARRREAALKKKREDQAATDLQTKAARELAAEKKKAADIARAQRDEQAAAKLGLDPKDFNVQGLLSNLNTQFGEVAEQGAFAMLSPFLALSENIAAAEESVLKSLAKIEEKTERLKKMGGIVGEAFGAGMAQIISGSKSAKAAVVDMVGTIVSGALRASQANIIAAMTSAGMFAGPAAPFVIPALVGSGIALVEGLFAAIPALASGGITTGPTLAMIGDNASGKEAVIPFERMGQFLDMAGAGADTKVTGRLQGMDLLLSNRRAEVARNRIT